MRQEGFYEEFHSFYYYSGSTRSWKMKGLHIHKEYELLLFMSGGASIRIGSRMYQTRPGDLFLINNREYHKTEGAEGAAYSRYVLMFDPDWILGLEPALGYRFSRLFEDREEGGVRLHLSGGTLEQVIRQMERIEGYSRRREDEAGQVLLKLCILELLVKLDEFSRSLEAGGGDGWENCGRAGWGKVGREPSSSVGREPGPGARRADQILRARTYRRAPGSGGHRAAVLHQQPLPEPLFPAGDGFYPGAVYRPGQDRPGQGAAAKGIFRDGHGHFPVLQQRQPFYQHLQAPDRHHP